MLGENSGVFSWDLKWKYLYFAYRFLYEGSYLTLLLTEDYKKRIAYYVLSIYKVMKTEGRKVLRLTIHEIENRGLSSSMNVKAAGSCTCTCTCTTCA